MKNKAYNWEEKSIEWYKRAAEYQNFHKRLAEKAAIYLKHEDEICDMGCGLGYLGLELSRYVKKVDLIDIRPQAIEFVKNNIGSKKFNNCTAYVGDFESSVCSKKYDALIMCFFGHLTEAYYLAGKWTEKKLVAVCNASEKRSFSANEKSKRCVSLKQTEDFFRANDILYEYEEFSLEFGQPFERMEDAVSFMSYYDNRSTEKEIRRSLAARLIETDTSQYKYYLPNEKKLCMFIISF